MKAIFNSRSIDSDEPVLKLTNRAFCYGDGLFETIVTGPHRINLIDNHLRRLKKGSQSLGIIFPEDLTLSNLKLWVEELIEENKITGDYRVKIHLWRNEGGLYTPSQNHSSFLIELSQNDMPLVIGDLSIGLNEEYVNTYSPISRFKSKNALKYIMLGKIRQERNLDDIIMLDSQGRLSESFASNLFWIDGDDIFTPSLLTGCVSGVMRDFILEFMRKTGSPVKEVLVDESALESCSSIFTSNGAGLKWFNHYEGRPLASPVGLLENLIKRLQQP